MVERKESARFAARLKTAATVLAISALVCANEAEYGGGLGGPGGLAGPGLF